MSELNSMFSLADDKKRLEAELEASKYKVKHLEAQYEALHEDYMHAITNEHPDLNGKVITLVDGDKADVRMLRAVSEHYNATLIMPQSEETLCYAIKVADHVLCLENCPNQNLCSTTYATCAKYRKPVHLLPSNDVHDFSRQLASLAVEVKPMDDKQQPVAQ